VRRSLIAIVKYSDLQQRHQARPMGRGVRGGGGREENEEERGDDERGGGAGRGSGERMEDKQSPLDVGGVCEEGVVRAVLAPAELEELVPRRQRVSIQQAL
jgi:hypothetical protein